MPATSPAPGTPFTNSARGARSCPAPGRIRSGSPGRRMTGPRRGSILTLPGSCSTRRWPRRGRRRTRAKRSGGGEAAHPVAMAPRRNGWGGHTEACACRLRHAHASHDSPPWGVCQRSSGWTAVDDVCYRPWHQASEAQGRDTLRQPPLVHLCLSYHIASMRRTHDMCDAHDGRSARRAP